MSTSVNLSRSDSMWIRCNGSGLSELLRPGTTWEWVEVDVPHSLLCALRHRDLIVQNEDGWMTGERLYERLDELGHVDILDESRDSDSGQLRFSE